MNDIPRRGLGKSLDALLGSVGRGDLANQAREELRQVPLDQLQPGRHQPAVRQFDPQALEELAASISAQGVIQPLVIRSVDSGRFEIVAGERRWRAAQKAGLKTVPAIVRELDERGAMAVALVENIQRADLNPMEESQALHRLVEDCALTHEQLALAVGKSRAAVSNLLRLVELNADVQTLVRHGELSLGHAKVLLGVQGERQSALARSAAQGQLSVRQTESLLRDRGAETPKEVMPVAARAAALEARLRELLGLPTHLQSLSRDRTRVVISCRSSAELEELVRRLSSPSDPGG